LSSASLPLYLLTPAITNKEATCISIHSSNKKPIQKIPKISTSNYDIAHLKRSRVLPKKTNKMRGW
jgi:hypothetical protein